MIEKVKHFSLRKKTNEFLKSRNLSHRNSKLERLGILTAEGFLENEKLERFIKNFNLKENQIKVFYFMENQNKIPTLLSNQISAKQISFSGKIRNQDAIDFLDFPFDVFIGIYPEHNELMNLMAARSKANFKIGFMNMDQRIFDLILNIDVTDESLLASETMKYLKILNKI